MTTCYNFIRVNDFPIGYSVSQFPDGELNVTLSPDINRKLPVIMEITLKDSDGLFILMQLSDILKRNEIVIEKIQINYLMGMRCDRLFSLDRPFTLKIIADVINSFNAKKVEVVEPHSGRTLDLINNSAAFEFTAKIAKCYKSTDKNIVFIAPDKGALERYKATGIDFIGHFEKQRDLKSGKITSLEFVPVPDINLGLTEDKVICIIDGLCDGGGTFTLIGEYLKKNSPNNKTTIILTHLIQEVGLKKLCAYYDTVYISDSYKDYKPVIESNPEEYINARVIRVNNYTGNGL